MEQQPTPPRFSEVGTNSDTALNHNVAKRTLKAQTDKGENPSRSELEPPVEEMPSLADDDPYGE